MLLRQARLRGWMINLREMLMLGAVAAATVAIPVLVTLDQRDRSIEQPSRPEAQPCQSGSVAISPNHECAARSSDLVPDVAQRPAQAPMTETAAVPSRPWTDPDITAPGQAD